MVGVIPLACTYPCTPCACVESEPKEPEPEGPEEIFEDNDVGDACATYPASSIPKSVAPLPPAVTARARSPPQ